MSSIFSYSRVLAHVLRAQHDNKHAHSIFAIVNINC